MRTLLATSVLVLFFSSNLLGQNISELEKKRGFRDFTLGQDFSMYKDRVWMTIADEEQNKNKKVKEYSLKDEIKVKDLDFMVTLKFYQDKLIEVSVYRLTKNINEFSSIKQSLFSLYGAVDNSHLDPNKPSDLRECNEVFLWNSESVGLELVHCTKEEPFLVEFTIWDIKANLKILKDEF
ncbi:MAG: hypothetical protein J0L67_18560 [Cytophagales bacterium]|jgi:hypothetical protein|nr:hypothetical protein [Cytophagales bacterium]